MKELKLRFMRLYMNRNLMKRNLWLEQIIQMICANNSLEDVCSSDDGICQCHGKSSLDKEDENK